MAGYDDVDAERNWIDPQRLEIVQNEYRLSREAREFGVVVSLGPIADVDISPNRGDRRDPAERIDDVGTTDVAGMNDVINTREATFRFGPQQAVRVRYDADPPPHSRAIWTEQSPSAIYEHIDPP